MSWKSRANEHRRQSLPLPPLLFLGSQISLEQFYSFLIMSRALASSLEDISSAQALCFTPAAWKRSHQLAKAKPQLLVKGSWESNSRFELMPHLPCQSRWFGVFWGGWSVPLQGTPPFKPHDLPIQKCNAFTPLTSQRMSAGTLWKHRSLWKEHLAFPGLNVWKMWWRSSPAIPVVLYPSTKPTTPLMAKRLWYSQGTVRSKGKSGDHPRKRRHQGCMEDWGSTVLGASFQEEMFLHPSDICS